MTKEKKPKEEEKQLIETLDEEGNVVNFELFDIVEFKEKEYALLLPVNEETPEEGEVILMRLTKDGDEYLFEAIEDDTEFSEVAEYIENFEESTDEE